MLPRLMENGENVFAIVIDREARQLRIGIALVIAIDSRCVVACADADPADVQAHLRRMKDLVKQLFARR